MEFLHVIVPQGTPENPKMEKLFVQFLDNLHKTAEHDHISFELFGYNQYTYFFIGCDAEISKLIEGLIYSAYPTCEIKHAKDYTAYYRPDAQALAGASLRFRMSDIYPILAFDHFEVDSLSGVFSILSKMGRSEQAWVQMVIHPTHETWIYHFGRRKHELIFQSSKTTIWSNTRHCLFIEYGIY